MTKFQQLRDRATVIAQRTQDAYSFDRYGERGWRACALMLARRGYTDRQIEALLRSKVTRWASDNSNARYGRVSSIDLARYLDLSLPGDMEMVERGVGQPGVETGEWL